MPKRLEQHITSSYIEAANRLAGKKARRKIVAYVEGFEDVLFWSNLLRQFESDRVSFEVMLPSRGSLGKGKKVALANRLGDRLGSCMIACVDADYDFLIDDATPTSQMVCTGPYVFHTYAYAIENYQCYAPSLYGVCVAATLNDHRLFDFEAFLAEYSRIVWPLFVWNVWSYRYGFYKQFALQDFFRVVALKDVNFYHPERSLEALRHKVNSKIARLQKLFPQGRTTYKPFMARLLEKGLTPETTYLFMRGHDVFDGVVLPLVGGVCERLRRERESEIKHGARHKTQMQNELSGYQHAVSPAEVMLRKHTGYVSAPVYARIVADLRTFLKREKLL